MSNSEADTCSFSCRDVSDERLSDIDQWECPHPPVDGKQRCIYHLPPGEKDADEVAVALVEQVNHTASEQESDIEPSRRTQFIGAKFEHLTLKYTELNPDHNFPIDLRDAVVTETIDCSEMIINNPFWLSGAEIGDTADFRGTRFVGDPRFVGTEFEGEVHFMGSRFEGFTEFNLAQFDEKADFQQATFGTDVRFIGTHFDDDVDFRPVTFGGDAVFMGSVFWGDAEFQNASFEGDANFDDAVFNPRGNFRNCTYEGRLVFEPRDEGPEYAVVDLQRSEINRGRLSQGEDSFFLYNLTAATVGDIALDVPGSDPQVFEYFQFLQTTFDGFDFANYRDALLASDWVIHDLDLPEEAEEWGDFGPSVLEATYLKAKNGASEVGDAKAASEFFSKELQYRRQGHRTQVSDASNSVVHRLQAVGRWIANAMLDYSAGYGEKPSRVVGMSIFVVLLFAGLFWLSMPNPPYGTPLGYGIVSLESFVTLVLGGAEKIQNPAVRMLAEIEGFMGAFLVGLFVFTLTRSVHR